MRAVSSIVVHCSATPPSMDIGVAEIDRWHRARGFLRVGYHYVIRRGGHVEAGRDLEEPGAHAAGHNRDSVGICLIGGVDDHDQPDNNFTPAQFQALAGLRDLLILRYPTALWCGHRDLPGVAKACPSFDVRAWIKTLT